jgi:peptidoglycan/LPS O-acetylase OafA/YrhL
MKEYSPDIDGLRAIAVVSVVLFHCGIAIVPGGFVGVDVFFVISGFLITRNILQDRASGEFTFAKFYLRRVRRLFPALFVTTAISCVFSLLLLNPQHLQEFGQSVVYSLFSAANIFFWMKQGYFDSAAEFKPLLHFWSLGVEEQFYLVWPAALILILLIRRRALPVVLILVAVATLALSQRLIHTDPASAFFLTPFRIWEFALGALCLWIPKIPRQWMRESLSIAGLLMIFISVLVFTRETPFPGVTALLPCLGAASVICSRNAPISGWVLRNRPAVAVGLISYSLYLVHWPILVFYKYFVFRSITSLEQAGIIAASLLFGAALYWWIEKPFRYGATRPLNQVLAAALLAFTVAPTYIASRHDGWPWRLSTDQQRHRQQIRTPSDAACQRTAFRVSVYDCMFGAVRNLNDFDVALVGDSHSWHWVPGLDALFRTNDIAAANFGSGGSLFFSGGLSYDNTVPRTFHQKMAVDIDHLLIQRRPAVVILSNRWSFPWHTFREPGEDGDRKFFTYGPYHDFTPQSSQAAMRAALTDTLKRYKNAGIYTILLGQVPYPGAKATQCLTRPKWLPAVHCQTVTKAAALKNLASTDRLLLDMKRMFPSDVTVILPSEFMCGEGNYCAFIEKGGVLYQENGHLSSFGSRIMAREHLREIVSIVKKKLSARD